MHEKLSSLCVLLNTISNRVYELAEKELPVINPRYGDSLPYLNSRELSDLPDLLAKKIKNTQTETLTEEEVEIIEEVIEQLNGLKDHVVPQIFSKQPAHGSQTQSMYIPHPVYSFMLTLSGIENSLDWLLGWSDLNAEKTLVPKSIRRKLRSINAEIEQISPDLKSLSEQISTIKDANNAAIELPIVLKELEEARIKANRLLKDVETAEQTATISTDIILNNQANTDELKTKAEELLNKAEQTLASATSVSLAKAFHDNANKLKSSIRAWTALLSLALVGVLAIGYWRAPQLSSYIETHNDISWPILLVQMTLTALLISGPVWLGWVATKQIKQRFKLEQDYSFKAASANAYEGYSRVAEQFHNETSERLFNAALSRLEESPIRLMDVETHGTPLTELVKDLLNKKNEQKDIKSKTQEEVPIEKNNADSTQEN
ncbi:hypothetical protein [Hydromonas duriensis]|uniref:Uncharacterized protein n=1 Tax=Hydromonas duriensis TaxID=1527608 RepID=A0A4R6Y547_9BURK|nr:hypothetical protein [Hydromonas duriensis]TDR30405.1 hypothetical protein DFR44_12121 [Hydromonas duriensis]